MAQTLEQAIRSNREREIRVFLASAAKDEARATYFRKQAKQVQASPKAWADPDGEVRFLLACAEPFARAAASKRAMAAAVQIKLDA
jgi:hypothetical protein